MKNFLIDIDGVLADYAEGFTRFYNFMMDASFVKEDMKLPGFRHNFPIPHWKYEQLKRAYRQFRFKITLKVIPGFKEFSGKHLDDFVNVWTSRAVDEFPQNEELTKEWLIRNNIRFNGELIFLGGESKLSHLKLLGKEATKTIILVDDDAEFLKKAKPLVKKVYLFDQPYNRKEKVGTRIKSLKEIK